MKWTIFTLLFPVLGVSFLFGQAPREDRMEIEDASRTVLSIELSYTSKTVDDALSQKLKEEKIKTKTAKGFTLSEGSKITTITPDLMDYFFKVESKDKTKAVLFLGISKGNNNFITPESDPKIWEGGKTFLNEFVGYLDQYQLSLDIAAQEKVVKDAEKALEKSVKEGEDLSKKLEENKKDQEAKRADLQKQSELLNQLKSRKKR
jgi:hypothetical protein